MTTIADTRAVFREWLYLPDTGALDAVLGAVAANRMEGDPVWLLLVGPPGGGKSEILNAISELDDAHPTGPLTEASLLSGTPQKEHAQSAKGGLLRAIGDYGIIVAKDFGSVLSMSGDSRSSVLAALREVYDGAWTRHVGSDGGRTLSWKGKVGMIGGVTPTIDRHHAVMGAMGERFILYRLPEVDPNVQARQALGHAGRERQMRKELASAIQTLLEEAATEPRERTEEETLRLIGLATLVVRARSAVERDSYSREIELVPGPEAPTRIIIVLDRLLAGLDAIGVDRDTAWTTVTKAALDSVPALRLAVMHALMEGQKDTNQVATDVRHPSQTTRRALEDLVAHHLVELERQDAGKAHLWSLSSFAKERLKGFPEMAEETFPETANAPSDPLTSGRAPSPNPLTTNAKATHEQVRETPITAQDTTSKQGFPVTAEEAGTFPEMAEDMKDVPLISSSKDLRAISGKPHATVPETANANTESEAPLDDEDRRLISLYVHAGPPERQDPPGDLHDTDPDIPF